MKALFIPLKTEYYRDFERGDKTVEYRLAGPRWNARECYVGREVNIRRGYSTPDNLYGVVTSFDVLPLAKIQGGLLRIAIINCYRNVTQTTPIACIGIELKRGEIREAK